MYNVFYALPIAEKLNWKLKMLFREYNFIMKRITKSLSILVNKEGTNLLKFYFIYFEN